MSGKKACAAFATFVRMAAKTSIPMGNAKVVAAVLVVGGGLALASGAAAGNELGRLSVYQPCCSGAALQGSRASITAPGIPSVGTGRQALSAVMAGDQNADGSGGLGWAQIGVQMDNGVAVDGDPSCFTTGLLTGFYEWWDYSTDTMRCKTLGNIAAGSTHLYSTAEQSLGGWQLFLDGNPQLSSPIIAMRGSYAPNAANVDAGGEINYLDTVEPVSWTTSFAGSGNTAWQRYNFTIGWYTIQQTTNVCNGSGGASCTNGSWIISTGSFPTTWSVSH